MSKPALTANARTWSGAEIVRPRADLAWVEIDGEGVVYDALSERVHLLNPTAVLVWSLLDGESRIDDLAAAIAAAAGLAEAVVRRDLVALVENLAREGLLELV